MTLPTDPAARHREIADGFTRVVEGVFDWEALSPVAGWTARDVVGHLVEWFPGFLAGGGVTLPTGPSVTEDPVAAWRAHAGEVQSLLDGDLADELFTHTHVPTMPLAEAVDRFYTADVFMHTWDLARATGQEADLDESFCAELLSGMVPMEDMMRGSGQYGPRVDVPAHASAQDQLLGFIGRDPHWQPPGA